MSAPIVLTTAEEAEKAEYDRIINFHNQAVAGTHPLVKVPEHSRIGLRPAATSTSTSSVAPAAPVASITSVAPIIVPSYPRLHTTSTLPLNSRDSATPTTFDANHDYYKDLGLHVLVKPNLIERAYQYRFGLYSPNSPSAYAKYASSNPDTVRSVEEDFKRICLAYGILSSPTLRKEYDDARCALIVPQNWQVYSHGGSRG